MNTQVSKLFAIAACVMVIAALIAGFVVVGSPWHARLMRLDERRIEDLKALRTGIQSYADLHHRLPQDLTDIAKSAENTPEAPSPSIKDPVTRAPYAYRTTGKASYQLCATFATAAKEDAEDNGVSAAAPIDEPPSFWAHPEGRRCYSLTATIADAAAPAAKPAVVKP